MLNWYRHEVGKILKYLDAKVLLTKVKEVKFRVVEALDVAGGCYDLGCCEA